MVLQWLRSLVPWCNRTHKLLAAIRAQDSLEVRSLINGGADPDLSGPDGLTPLMAATEQSAEMAAKAKIAAAKCRQN